jgi:hypothetical protein
LADGKAAPGTEYARLTQNARTPDLRGAFVRGLNLDRRDHGSDPDGTSRKAGDYQSDSFQAHGHQVEEGTTNAFSTGTFFGVFGTNKPLVGRVLKPTKLEEKYGEPRVSAETRPKNVAVYYYIKVNSFAKASLEK